MKVLPILLVAITPLGFASEAGVLERSVIDGMEMIAKGEIPQAMNEIRVGINCFPLDPRKVPQERVAALDKQIAEETNGEKKAALLVYKAVILLSLSRQDGGAIDKAVEMLDAAEKADPKLPEVFNTRGVCRLVKGEREAAMPDLDKAIELNPRYADAIKNRSSLFAAMGQKEKALDDQIRYQRLLGRVNYIAQEK